MPWLKDELQCLYRVALLMLNTQEAGQGEQREHGRGNTMMRKDRVEVEGKENVWNMREKAECEGNGL